MSGGDKWRAMAKTISEDIKKATAVTREAFAEEVFDLEADIIEKFYSRKSEKGTNGLKARTGRTRRAWHASVSSSRDTVTGRIWNDAPYAASHMKDRTVRPGPGKKWLAIPIGEAKTAAGVPRWKGPRDPKAPSMQFVKVSPSLAFLFPKKKRGAKKGKGPLYVLKKKVFIPAHTDKLFGFVKQRAGKINQSIMKKLLKV